QQPRFCPAELHHRAIIAGSSNDLRILLQLRKNLGEEPIFAEFPQRPHHGCNVPGKASARRVIALKIACIVMETSSDPLHSYARVKQAARTNSGANEGRCA